MPYLTTLEFPEIDQLRYEELCARLTSISPPPGILFHSCAAVSGGWRIVDIWESASAFDAFIDQTLLPAARGLGWSAPSRRECFATYHAGMVQG
ncbi:hypothetical protein EA797_07780 [Stutzerimonas zhaodongensis]|uniref:ABM domain-containing protein n=1 Tax=Stutzerimonas zhaodongensis TaxID=1176257 RepID=A0A3M2HY72_9GAMM|nr:hypothetical protein [Stutzerimonas zhaodongensis]MCQ2029370.1 hypothetical protein [Stutzerimonas zhaodongensis]MCQ4316848.1 hypothetical protein [Stutzerimonas zhaodongensis]RMH92590.1 hypothetical protein EA797_07780 [Stutzerimonas zhaodongensis]